MNKQCNVCGAGLGDPIYVSDSAQALTSLCELQRGRVRVWSCQACGHLLADALDDTEGYYGEEYRILLDHEDEDQIYELRDGEVVYRTRHQVDTLLAKLELPMHARLLDYGCAKASTPKALLARRPDVEVHVFDVSEMYREHWSAFVPAGNQAVNDAPAHWVGRFDLVTSFFALEHIPEPAASVSRVHALLADAGEFYGIVPDTFGNVADFIVLDHVNHFTVPSLQRLLEDAGFGDVEIDSGAHRGALVFRARKHGARAAAPALEANARQARELAAYWSGLGKALRDAETRHAGVPAAIYGSGFYGAWILSTLRDATRISCLLDRSPYQQGKQLFGKPIVAPAQLPAEVGILYVGLNPAIARDVIAELHWSGRAQPQMVFLDGR
jgi:cyclopropane fatty-acyl-phospholipid synthase-like methyltransferase